MLTHFIFMEKTVLIKFQNNFHNFDTFYFYEENSVKPFSIQFL